MVARIVIVIVLAGVGGCLAPAGGVVGGGGFRALSCPVLGVGIVTVLYLPTA